MYHTVNNESTVDYTNIDEVEQQIGIQEYNV